MDNEKIVNSIKDLCKTYNLTVTKLEEKLGMSQGLIGRWNKSDPSLSKIIDIANFFNVSLDTVIGNRKNVDDIFLKKLTTQTLQKKISWNKYTDSTKIPKKYSNPYFFPPECGFDEYKYRKQFFELSFYTNINDDSYISIYALCEFNKISKPLNLQLFIQPDKNADLIEQKYNQDQLQQLWILIISKFDATVSDELKAEEFKKIFVTEETINDIYKNNQLNDIDITLVNSSSNDFTKIIDTPEFQKIQEILSSKEFQKIFHLVNTNQKED